MSTIHQRDILKVLAAGAVIRVEYHNHPPSSARRTYRISSTQQTLREETVNRLLEDRLIRPNADGLFGNDGPVQSYPSSEPAKEGLSPPPLAPKGHLGQSVRSVHGESMPISERPRKYNYRVITAELRYATPPYSHEYIATRHNAKWRIRDINDKAVGWAENEEAADFICDHLNKVSK